MRKPEFMPRRMSETDRAGQADQKENTVKFIKKIPPAPTLKPVAHATTDARLNGGVQKPVIPVSCIPTQ